MKDNAHKAKAAATKHRIRNTFFDFFISVVYVERFDTSILVLTFFAHMPGFPYGLFSVTYVIYCDTWTDPLRSPYSLCLLSMPDPDGLSILASSDAAPIAR